MSRKKRGRSRGGGRGGGIANLMKGALMLVGAGAIIKTGLDATGTTPKIMQALKLPTGSTGGIKTLYG